jgi:hypothetical protein
MDNGAPDAKTLRMLRWLVTGLTVTMIGGFLTIVVLFVMRFNAMGKVDLPDTITLPGGVTATAFTQGQSWYAVVGQGAQGEEILIYSRITGALRQRIAIKED